MKGFLVAVMLALSIAASAFASDPVKKLASVQDFAFGGIGAAGTPSEGEVAFREILKRPSAEKDFLGLLSSGNPQAQCYALVALHHLDSKVYASQAARFGHNKTKVSTISGCIKMEEPMLSVTARIGSGRYDPYLKAK